MKTIDLNEFKNSFDRILSNVVVADEFVKVQVEDNLYAVIISESEWDILREGFAKLVGGVVMDAKGNRR